MSDNLDTNKIVSNIAADLFKHYFDNLIASIRTKASNTIRKRLATSGQAFTRYLNSAYDQTFFCKTPFSDEPIPIKDIFVPLDLESGSAQKPDCLWGDLAHHGERLILVGTAGSGKSTTFRMFFQDEIKRGTSIPILVTLRDVNDLSGNISELLLRTVNIGGNDLDSDLLRLAASQGMLSFFFDGLDEVNKEFYRSTVNAIQTLALDYPECLIVVSSRPSDDFRSWEAFSVLKVQPMNLHQSLELIKRLPFDDEEKRKKFTTLLESQLYNSHRSFASNPLLLSLMLLMYANNAEIPNRWHQFYEEAYLVLLSRHDARKPGGYQRQLRSGLEKESFKKLFSLFSAYTFIAGRASFDDDQLHSDATVAIEGLRYNCAVDDFLHDCETSVCLLVREGHVIRFLHRTFQEYFAAVFIGRHVPVSRAREVLGRVGFGITESPFLLSLFGVSPERYFELVLIPCVDKMLSELDFKGVLTDSILRAYVTRTGASISVANVHGLRSGESSQRTFEIGATRSLDDVCFPAFIASKNAFPELFKHDDSAAFNRIDELLKGKVNFRRTTARIVKQFRLSEMDTEGDLYTECLKLSFIGQPTLMAIIEARRMAGQFLEQAEIAASLILPPPSDDEDMRSRGREEWTIVNAPESVD